MSKNVEALAALLNQPVETIKTALEAEGGLVDRITAFKQDYAVLNRADKETLVKNAKEEGKTELLADFKPELLQKKDINRIVAWKLEDIENDIKARYNFDGEFRGLNELVDKIVKTKSGNNNGSPDQDVEIQKLKQQIVTLTSEKDEALEKMRKENDDFVVRTEFERGMSGLDLDYEQEAVDKQRKLLRDSFNSTYEVKRKEGKLFVYEKGKDEPMLDEKRDPLPLNTIINRHATDYGFKIKRPESGGQGGSSSSKTGNDFSGMSRDDLMAHLASKKIQWSSPEGEAMFREWRAANKQ